VGTGLRVQCGASPNKQRWAWGIAAYHFRTALVGSAIRAQSVLVLLSSFDRLTLAGAPSSHPLAPRGPRGLRVGLGVGVETRKLF